MALKINLNYKTILFLCIIIAGALILGQLAFNTMFEGFQEGAKSKIFKKPKSKKSSAPAAAPVAAGPAPISSTDAIVLNANLDTTLQQIKEAANDAANAAAEAKQYATDAKSYSSEANTASAVSQAVAAANPVPVPTVSSLSSSIVESNDATTGDEDE